MKKYERKIKKELKRLERGYKEASLYKNGYFVIDEMLENNKLFGHLVCPKNIFGFSEDPTWLDGAIDAVVVKTASKKWRLCYFR